MRANWKAAIIALAVTLTAWAGPALSGSFTFDYENPTGAGSSFADAVHLNTVGAVTDSMGEPLGFTKLGGPGGASALTLGPGGLAWATGVGGANLGLPAPTDGLGNVKITARFSGSTWGWNADFELLSIGWGPETAFSIRDLLQAIVFHNSLYGGGDNILINARLPDSTAGLADFAATPNIEQLSVSAPAAAGSLTTVEFIGDGGSVVAATSITDGLGTNPYLLGQSDTYAWILFGGGFGGTLRSITIEGPNVVVPDFDGDGVSDGSDPCPLDPANDADGDGFCADVDTCPGGDDGVNSDGEGLPDFCDVCPFDAENDADSDGICESDDNCPLIANDNQADQDGDLAGDACDDDIDEDGDPNDADNCPFDANADQADADSDGAGDVCDDDRDGDGVLDAGDICVPSPVDEVVNADGCAVSDLCPCAHPDGMDRWKNHGAYVSCVAHTTNDFVDVGLITEMEKGDIQAAAGESSCGHKNR